MKLNLLILNTSLLLFPPSSFGQEILHVDNTCDQKYTGDIATLSTRRADFYTYYINIAFGSCKDVALHNGQVDKISEHFSRIGSYLPSASLHGYSKEYILQKVKEGDVDAKGILVQSSIEYDSVSYQRAKPIIFNDIPQSTKEKYINEILVMADKGDVRAIFPAMAYYLFSTSSSADEIFIKQKKAKSLFYRYANNHVPAQHLYLAFLLSAKDISFCADRKETTSSYMNKLGLTKALSCMPVYNIDAFEKISLMDARQRLVHFKGIISSMPSYPMKDYDIDGVLNEISILAYFNTPYSKETLFFLLSIMDGHPNRAKEALHWLEVSDSSSKLMKTILACMSIKPFDVKTPKDMQVISDFKSSGFLYSLSFYKEQKWDDFIAYIVKEVLPTGNYGSLRYVYFAYVYKKDGDRAWAIITALKKYDPLLSAQLEENFDRHKFKRPTKEKTADIMGEFSSYLPSPSIAFDAIGIDWDSEAKPYILKDIGHMINNS